MYDSTLLNCAAFESVPVAVLQANVRNSTSFNDIRMAMFASIVKLSNRLVEHLFPLIQYDFANLFDHSMRQVKAVFHPIFFKINFALL